MGNKATNKSFREAAATNNIKTVRKILKKYSTTTQNESTSGEHYMFWAVSLEKYEIVELLVDRNISANATCHIESCHLQVHLQGSHPCNTSFLWSPLHEVCRKGNLELLQLLLKRDTLDLTIRAHHGMPPLHIAAWHGHAHIVSTLINNGCDVNILDSFLESALVVPICQGDINIVDMLLHAGCRLNTRSWGNIRKIGGKNDHEFRSTLFNRQGPYTLLQLAIKYSWLNIARLLLRHGFNPKKYRLHDILKSVKGSLGVITPDSVRFISCFIAAGYQYDVHDEPQLRAMINVYENDADGGRGNVYDNDLLHQLVEQSQQPLTLADMTLAAIRRQLRLASKHSSILTRVKQLELPLCLQEQLSLQAYSDDHAPIHVSSNVEVMYFAMPRKRRTIGNVYVNFWQTTCCWNSR